MLPEFPYGQYITNFFRPGSLSRLLALSGTTEPLLLYPAFSLYIKDLLTGET